MPEHATAPHAAHHGHPWRLGLTASLAAIIAVPYVLPILGIGDAGLPAEIAAICGSTTGGLAQGVEALLGATPWIGGMLATAGWAPAIASGVIGIAGVMLGDYIHRRFDREGHIPWGSIITYAALGTSLLIALPGILSGISMGLTYLADLFGGFSASESMREALATSIGFSGTPHDAPTGLAGLLPHFFTCGRALLPLLGGLFMDDSPQDAAPAPEQKTTLRLVYATPTIRNQPTRLAFELRDAATDRPLTPDMIATTHTEKLHTMLVDHTLTDYQHLHPIYDPASGLFTCEFTPRIQQPYRMWNDFTRIGDSSTTIIPHDLPNAFGYVLPPQILPTNRVTQAGVQLAIAPTEPLEAGKPSQLTLTITDRQGHPARLAPIMGAMAHLVGFSQDGAHFIHCHPIATPDALTFHLTPEQSGVTKFFLQINHDGQQLTLPFGQWIHPPAQFAHRERLTTHAPHMHMAM